MKVMTHVIAGYPSFEETLTLVKSMQNIGVDYVEVQIPFNDPIGDGATILEASNIALQNGANTKRSLELIEKIIKNVDIPIFIMTYSNIALNYGYEKFIQEAKQIGVKALIIPDIPLDSEKMFWYSLKKYNLDIIPVVSPTKIIKNILAYKKVANHILYSTLQIGITGSSSENIPKTYLKELKNEFKDLEIATGFGIDSTKKIEMLKGYSDIAVIGSAVIKIMQKDGIREVERFLKDIVQTAHNI